MITCIEKFNVLRTARLDLQGVEKESAATAQSILCAIVLATFIGALHV